MISFVLVLLVAALAWEIGYWLTLPTEEPEVGEVRMSSSGALRVTIASDSVDTLMFCEDDPYYLVHGKARKDDCD